MSTTGYLRSNGKKSLGFARNKPIGTTGLLSALPTIAGTTGGRPVPPAVQISATKVRADLASRYYRRFTGTTGTGRYHRSEPGTTGSSFSRKTQEKDWHCRYQKCLLGILNIITKSRLSFLILITVPKMPNLSLIPLKPSCHPQHDMRDVVLKYCKHTD